MLKPGCFLLIFDQISRNKLLAGLSCFLVGRATQNTNLATIISQAVLIPDYAALQ